MAHICRLVKFLADVLPAGTFLDQVVEQSIVLLPPVQSKFFFEFFNARLEGGLIVLEGGELREGRIGLLLLGEVLERRPLDGR